MALITPRRQETAGTDHFKNVGTEFKTADFDAAIGTSHYPLDINQYSNSIVFYFNSISTILSDATQKNAGMIGNNSNYFYFSGVDIGDIPEKNKAFKATLDAQRISDVFGKLKTKIGDSKEDWAVQAKQTIGKIVNTTYKRTSNLIQLLMPHSIQVNYGAAWEDINANPNGIGLLAVEGMRDGESKDKMLSVIGILGKELGENLVDLGVEGQGLGEALSKSTLNPYTQQAFRGMGKRQFQFQWQFTAHNAAELQSIDTIISLFKFHAHPALDFSPGSGGGNNYLEYPGNIDIEWYTKDVETNQWSENAWLPKITTCVIESINTDYAPNGQYAFFIGSGAPVQINFSITLKEIHSLMKQDIARGA
jgi:hypothetical protein